MLSEVDLLSAGSVPDSSECVCACSGERAGRVQQ